VAEPGAALGGLAISTMHRRDLKAVLGIEQRVFPEPWSSTIFSSELALRRGRSYKVAKLGRRTVGYRGVMLGGEEAHITTLAVVPELQRRGVATALLLDALVTSIESGATQLSLEVAFSNKGAQALYRSFGMAPVGVRKGYYQMTGEDAYVMFVYEIDSAQYASRLEKIEADLRRRPALER
jgi:[ribosomal protein S18]-alanine N-acetyltransferase